MRTLLGFALIFVPFLVFFALRVRESGWRRGFKDVAEIVLFTVVLVCPLIGGYLLAGG